MWVDAGSAHGVGAALAGGVAHLWRLALAWLRLRCSPTQLMLSTCALKWLLPAPEYETARHSAVPHACWNGVQLQTGHVWQPDTRTHLT